MKLRKKPNFERGIVGGATAQGLEIGALAIAMAIVVLVPVVLDPSTLLTDSFYAYFTPKFKVLMGFSAMLLVAVLGIVALRRREPLGVPVLIPALAFLGISALSTLFSDDITRSLFGDRSDGLLSLAAGVLLFYAVAICLNSPFRVRLFLAAGVTTAVLISIYGIFQRYGFDTISGWTNPWYTDFGRPFSTVGNPIMFAGYLTLMMGAAAALSFKTGSSWKHRVPWLLALVAIGACWIYTDKRGPMLGAIVTLPVVLWFARHRMGTVRPLMLPIASLIGVMAVALAASSAFGITVSPRLMAILVAYLMLIGIVLWLSVRWKRAVWFSLVSLAILVAVGVAAVAVAAMSGNLSLDLSSQIRLLTWRDTVPMILDRPLLGYGPANFGQSFQPYVSEALTVALTTPEGAVVPIDKVHNDLLQVTADTGLLGLAAYVWIFVSYFRNVYRRGGWPLIALSGGVLAYIIQLQTAFPSLDTSVAFWSLLGASVAVMRIQDRESEEPQTQQETPRETESVRAALSAKKPKARIYERLVVMAVVVVLLALAVPTFLNQREEAAERVRFNILGSVWNTVRVYREVQAESGTYPEFGTYTQDRPIEDPEGNTVYAPPPNVTVTTSGNPEGDFIVEVESETLAGTFGSSFDNATGTYTRSS